MLKEKLEQSENERRMILDESKKDPLTRAYNRRCFDSDIEAFYRAKPRSKMSLAFIDGDKFKNVNDTYGHQAGDKVLQSIVDSLFAGIRDLKRTRVYRYGGEEFLILFIDEDRKTVLEKLNTIRQNIEKTPIDNLVNIHREEGDAEDAAALIQSVLYGEIIFGGNEQWQE